MNDCSITDRDGTSPDVPVIPEYIQVIMNELSPWEIGEVHRIHPRESQEQSYYSLLDSESRLYRADCCRMVNKDLYDIIKTRVPLSIFHDTPPSDESDTNVVRVHNEARAMYDAPWVTYVTEKCTFKRLKFTTTIDRETHLEHPPLEITALIAITKDVPYDENTHQGNYISSFGYFQDEPGKCNAIMEVDGNTKYYMSLEVAMQEVKDQILMYWFDINPTRKEQF